MEPHRFLQIYQRYAYTILYIYRRKYIQLVSYYIFRSLLRAIRDLSRTFGIILSIFYKSFNVKWSIENVSCVLNDQLKNI